jgi:hypothetical protein
MLTQNKILTEYVSDLLALERCICQTVGQQSKADEVQASAEAMELLSRLATTHHRHIVGLDNQLKALGSDPTVIAKEMVGSVIGLVAGTIEKFRSHALSRMLRDDHTALSHATLGYTALHSAARMLKNTSAADLALRHLQNLTPFLAEISEMIPSTIAREVASECPGADTSLASAALANAHNALKGEAVHQYAAC